MGLTLSFLYLQFFTKKSFDENLWQNKPYSRISHPHKFLSDKILSYLFEFILPLDKLKNISPSKKAKQTLEYIQKLRFTLSTLDQNEFKKVCATWHAKIQAGNKKDFLIGGCIRIPRNKNILTKWGILDNEKDLKKYVDNGALADGEVELYCKCSFSATVLDPSLQKEEINTEKNGFHAISDLKLKDLDPSVPILIWFHGGGLILGDASNDSFLKHTQSLIQLQKEYMQSKHPDYNDTPKLIILSVDYRLAPENPFPSGIVDSLSAASHVFESFPLSSIHIGGVSAGGNIATIVSLECCRRYPNRTKR